VFSNLEGDGVAFLEGEEGQHAVLVPFTLPGIHAYIKTTNKTGEKVMAKIYFTERSHPLLRMLMAALIPKPTWSKS
jgi:tRNA/tmRNA/rRNA uracil-C5-methylase (TrmA/RlmC/RlmD family)